MKSSESIHPNITLSLTDIQIETLKNVFDDAKRVIRNDRAEFIRYSMLYSEIFIQVAAEHSSSDVIDAVVQVAKLQFKLNNR